MNKLRTLPVTVWAVLLLFFSSTACGDNNDTIFTGFSGVVLIIIAILVIRHFMKKS